MLTILPRGFPATYLGSPTWVGTGPEKAYTKVWTQGNPGAFIVFFKPGTSHGRGQKTELVPRYCAINGPLRGFFKGTIQKPPGCGITVVSPPGLPGPT